MARPPSTKEGRTMTGKPSFLDWSSALASSVHMPPGGCLMSSLVRMSYHLSRSSASSMLLGCVPQIWTLPLPVSRRWLSAKAAAWYVQPRRDMAVSAAVTLLLLHTLLSLACDAVRRFWPVEQHSTAQHSTAQHSTAQHSTAQPSPAQPSPAQPSPAQPGTTPHSFSHGRPLSTSPATHTQ